MKHGSVSQTPRPLMKSANALKAYPAFYFVSVARMQKRRVKLRCQSKLHTTITRYCLAPSSDQVRKRKAADERRLVATHSSSRIQRELRERAKAVVSQERTLTERTIRKLQQATRHLRRTVFQLSFGRSLNWTHSSKNSAGGFLQPTHSDAAIA
jgi:hypothetical protein